MATVSFVDDLSKPAPAKPVVSKQESVTSKEVASKKPVVKKQTTDNGKQKTVKKAEKK